MSFLVQYVAVRKDLLTALKWPVGAVITQACHATAAVLHIFQNDPNTVEYMADLDRMHKVVLEVATVDELLALADSLATDNIDYKLWIEQPEDVATCLATKPYKKDQVQKYFKKFKIFK